MTSLKNNIRQHPLKKERKTFIMFIYLTCKKLFKMVMNGERD